MINIKSIRPGDKVHYGPNHRKKAQFENGIVKEVLDQDNEITKDRVRVVYNCGGKWENYQEYTSAITHKSDLFHGWVNWKL